MIIDSLREEAKRLRGLAEKLEALADIGVPSEEHAVEKFIKVVNSFDAVITEFLKDDETDDVFDYSRKFMREFIEIVFGSTAAEFYAALEALVDR